MKTESIRSRKKSCSNLALASIFLVAWTVLTLRTTQAISTATVSSSLSFNVSASSGSLLISGQYGFSYAKVDRVGGISADDGYNYGSPTSAASAMVDSQNQAYSSNGLSGTTFASNAFATLSLPPLGAAYGQANSYAFATLANPTEFANGFDVVINPFAAVFHLDIANDAYGTYSNANAYWKVAISYSAPRADGSTRDFLESQTVYANGAFADDAFDRNPFSFSVAKDAADIKLFWQTYVDATVRDETPASVPDSGSTLPLLGFVIVGVEVARRRFLRHVRWLRTAV